MSYSNIEKLASAVRNNVDSGLRGFHTNVSLSDELILDYVTNERLLVIEEWLKKKVISAKDLSIALNCVPVDCGSLERCTCKPVSDDDTLMAHFEIPLTREVLYIGTVDRMNPFLKYTSTTNLKNRKYRKRGKRKPYVWLDTTPNKNGMYDGFIFNAPLIKEISVVAVFKDLKLLKKFTCCSDLITNNILPIDNEIIDRVTKKLLSYYRQMAAPVLPNDLSYTAG